MVIALVAGGYLYWPRGKNRAEIESIAVMPFVNESRNQDVEYLSDGMSETLMSSLSQLPKLDRKVALKILPADVASNRDRMARFIREAKSAAPLSHPNIALSNRSNAALALLGYVYAKSGRRSDAEGPKQRTSAH